MGIFIYPLKKLCPKSLEEKICKNLVLNKKFSKSKEMPKRPVIICPISGSVYVLFYKIHVYS
jgi:hypothetical protein